MKRLLFTFLASAFIATSSFAQLTLSPATPAQMVANLLGPGVTATNITWTGSPAARATFTCGGTCSLGFPAGIMLSTGNASGQTSPASYFASTSHNLAGDAQLAPLAPGGLTTNDAAILEFDFSVASDSVKFEFIFGSEEYNDYVNTNFNDVFAFFISGPGITGSQNMAVIPTTTTGSSIVSINNVNNGGPFPGTASGPCTNCQYYVDNVNGTSFFLDGHTVPLLAKARVRPCETYHMKITIADVGDWVFDSDVFLKAQSFSSLGQISITANGVGYNSNATIYACQGDSVLLSLSPANNYNWNTGATTQSIWVQQPSGSNTANFSAFTFMQPSCFAFTTNINVVWNAPTATITPQGSLSLCPGGNVTLSANQGQSYLWSNGATTQNINVSAAGSYTVTVSNGPNCSATSTPVNVTVGGATANINGVLSLCNGANTTLTATPGTSYIWSNGATTQSINVSQAGNYTVTVTANGGCTATANANVLVNPTPVPVISGTFAACQGASATLNAPAGFTTYQWSNGASTSSISPTTPGTYTVTVTGAGGCTGTTSQVVTINPNALPVITGTFAACQGSTATLNAPTGMTSYSWSNGATTTSINPSIAGTYTVTVTNANGCTGSTSQAVTINTNPVPVISGTFSACQGASATLNAAPAGAASYVWSNGATSASISPNVTGTYTVTVTLAGGCSGSSSQAVTINPNPSPTIAGTFAACQGASASLNATPGLTTYSWSNGSTTSGINPTVAGTYTVTVTNINGCTGTTSQLVTINPNPAPAIAGTFTVCQGTSATLNATAGLTSYQWSNGATSATINPNATGTYTVTVTNSNGCTGTTSQAVLVNNNPTPVITGTFAVCSGSSATLNAPAGMTNYVWSNGVTTSAINPSTAGTFTVTVTDANGCVGSTSQLVTINSNPVPTISGTFVACQGNAAALNTTAGLSTYSWSNGASTASINPSVSGTYTVTVTNASGCTGTTSQLVTINPNPAPAIVGTFTVCQGASATLNATTGLTSYQWSNGATSATINPNATGTYTVTVTNSNGCTGTTSQAVLVNNNPIPAITGTFAVCSGSSATLNAPVGMTNYVWSNGATTSAINPSAAGTFTVTVTDVNGCNGSTSQLVTINSNPIPTISGTFVACQGNTTTLSAPAGFTYSWNNGASSGTINPGAAGLYTVTVTDANGCTGIASQLVTINSNPTPSISGTFAACQGFSASLNATPGLVSYQWSDGTSAAAINPSLGGTYTVTVTDVNGCIGTTTQLVTINANPVPVISGNNAICDGTTASFNAGGYASYVWSDGSTSASISPGTAGVYTVTVTDANGCIGSTSQSLTVYTLPTATIVGDNTICYGDNSDLNVSFTGTAPFTYVWTNGITNSSPVISSTNSSLVNVSPGSTNVYTLVSVSDANCPGTLNGAATITVNPLPIPVISGDLAICDGETSVLNATPGYVAYTWSNNSNSTSITTGTGGPYTVTVTDLNGCVGTSASANLVVNMVPEVSFIADTLITCKEQKGVFTNTSIYDSGSSFAWTFGDGSTSSASNPSHLYPSQGTYPISLTITTPAGCVSSNTGSIDIVFFPLPVADFVTSPNINGVFNGKVEFVDRSDFAVSWRWDFGDGFYALTQNTEHYFNEVGDFNVRLTVTNLAGCEDTHSETISIIPYFVPNAFTPNGDGINDNFFFSGYDLDVASYEMKIFDRWGSLMFAGQDQLDIWKGNGPDGGDAPQGTYAYRIIVKTRGGKEHVFNGAVNLIR
ncbi:MAG: choice-of-anchor L domain-containing protein [Bacteroidota bacterium]